MDRGGSRSARSAFGIGARLNVEDRLLAIWREASRDLSLRCEAPFRLRLNSGHLFRCYTDVMSTDELLAEALRLTRADRARVAEELLSSLEESDEEVASAWASELERRSRELAEGRVQTTSWETARTEILKELEQRRAARTTP